jgi:predicted RNase H-like HicB family nuclease
MKQLKIIIEQASDGTYSAYSEEAAIYGMGDTVEAAKKEALEGMRLYIENNDPKKIPAILNGKYEIVYQMDIRSLLQYYRGIFSNAAFERITGINQKQMQHYATGYRHPRPEMRKKIETALHLLGNELLSVKL